MSKHRPRSYSTNCQGQDSNPGCSSMLPQRVSLDQWWWWGGTMGNFSKFLTLNELWKTFSYFKNQTKGKPNFFKTLLGFRGEDWEEKLSHLTQKHYPLCSSPLSPFLSPPLPHSRTDLGEKIERQWKLLSLPHCLQGTGEQLLPCWVSQTALDCCSPMLIRKQNLKSQFWLRTLSPIFSWPWLWTAWSILNLIYNDGPCEAGKCYVNIP